MPAQVWKVPTPYFEANRKAMQARLRLLPYLYTALREAFEDGVSLLRPMCAPGRAVPLLLRPNADGARAGITTGRS